MSENSTMLFLQTNKRVDVYYDLIHIDIKDDCMLTIGELEHFRLIIRDILSKLAQPKVDN